MRYVQEVVQEVVQEDVQLWYHKLVPLGIGVLLGGFSGVIVR